MIQKTETEKAQAKAAKKAYKEANKNEVSERLNFEKEIADYEKNKPERILTGLILGEEILPNDYSVCWDYLYVIDDVIDGIAGKVIRSDIQGTVFQLKADLRKRGYKANNIYNCKMGARNLFLNENFR